MIYRLLILLALALVGIAVWLTLSPRQAEPVTAQNSGPARPDSGYAATDASLVETGADGRPLYTLQAHQIQQEPDTNIINLSTVHMSFQDSGGEWQAHADRAQARQDAGQIDLSGSVDLIGLIAGNTKPLHALTDKLHIDTHTNLVSTRSGATIDWGGIVVHAPSLVVNTKDYRVRMESDTHGHDAP
ncbi:MAG TPA: LPS export ABC transporter periplasmic protein LptC [Steroidobacteraceae bacterium]|nr:LPS export ABC transporter periplasmic protein LptC [Steroidobacteraceae bacterium]